MSLTAPLKWHGGKHYLANRIIALMPRHLHYVEPFAGGLSVLLARDPGDTSLWLGTTGSNSGVSEVVNDLNGPLVNFWRVARDPILFPQLQRTLELTPLAREEYTRARDHLPTGDAVTDAAAFFVFCRQSLAGRMAGFTGLTRSRTRRGINGNASEWLGAVDGLPAIHERLRPVVIERMDAIKLIVREDTAHTLFYCDPPYLHSTRATTGEYTHEMSHQSHEELLRVLACIKGKFILSGYRSELYDLWANARGWHRVEFEIANHAAGGDSKRRMVECCWMNYEPQER